MVLHRLRPMPVDGLSRQQTKIAIFRRILVKGQRRVAPRRAVERADEAISKAMRRTVRLGDCFQDTIALLQD